MAELKPLLCVRKSCHIFYWIGFKLCNFKLYLTISMKVHISFCYLETVTVLYRFQPNVRWLLAHSLLLLKQTSDKSTCHIILFVEYSKYLSLILSRICRIEMYVPSADFQGVFFLVVYALSVVLIVSSKLFFFTEFQ